MGQAVQTRADLEIIHNSKGVTPTVHSQKIHSSRLLVVGFLLCLWPGFLSGQTDSPATQAVAVRSVETPPVASITSQGNVAAAAESVNYCDPGMKRALVLSGGLKGAFQAGAVYHLIVHRHCDFQEFAGVSVGSLNAVILAQAPRDENPATSLNNMTERAEKLVKVWQGIQSPKQIFKPVWPGWQWAIAARYGLFGTQSMNSFDPLMKLIQTNVDVDALAERGRAVRVGSVSFWDGTYREVGPTATFPNNDRKYFLKYVYASALVPVVGKMPSIQQSEQENDPKRWIQYGDGGILNNTPIFNYFRKCPSQVSQLQTTDAVPSCLAWLRAGTPPPQQLQQLFVVLTGPFTRSIDTYPMDSKLLGHGSQQVTDGRKILLRTIDMILEADYRDDLTLMLEANEMLAWRKRYYDAAAAGLAPEQRQDFEQKFAEINRGFPLNSYNAAPGGDWSLPYELGMVAPAKVYTEIFDVDPKNIAEQLQYGCLAADRMMQENFGMTSMKEKCEASLPLPAATSAQSNRQPSAKN